MEVKLDLHIHSEHSPDGRMSLDEIVSCARARGLQGVAVAAGPAVPEDNGRLLFRCICDSCNSRCHNHTKCKGKRNLFSHNKNPP